MILRMCKWTFLGLAGLGIAGAFVFGSDLCSYISSSARSVQCAVKDSVPVEFQLRRARDLVDDIVPEMQANVRVIAQQEVEIEALQKDIEQSERALTDEKARVAKIRDSLLTQQASFT